MDEKGMDFIKNRIAPLVRPNILALKPYASARDEFQLGGDQIADYLFLDANENSLGAPIPGNYHRYPDPHQHTLKQLLATQRGVQTDQIFLGNGSDEAIDLLIRAFCIPDKDYIVVLPPTYGMYGVQAAIQGAGVLKIPLLPDFTPDVEAILERTDARHKLLFLCNPNNPSGNCFPREKVCVLLEGFRGIVVVDEAYQDFSGEASYCDLIEKYPNLVVLQTFSKAWGLAGLRLGMAFSNPMVVQILDRIKYPYNVNSATLELVQAAMGQASVVRAQVDRLIAARVELASALQALPCVTHVYPSAANFLLVQVCNADAIYAYLCAQGIVVRNRSKEPLCKNCLRITVGDTAAHEKLLTALKSYEPTA
ncbi:MAG: histidinol-phosphate transaminase [Saprospiraceae bacterium]|nr:histidinol-phosphate transaminase [Saprospiraceae bacterium]